MRRWLPSSITGLLLLLVAVWSAVQTRTWAARRYVGLLEAQRAQEQAERYLRISPALEQSGGSEAVASDLLARLNEALLEAGLPTGLLREVSPLPSPDNNPALSTPRASVSLAGLSLADFGRFLSTWRALEPGSTVTSIELTASSIASNLEPGLGIRLTLAFAVR